MAIASKAASGHRAGRPLRLLAGLLSGLAILAAFYQRGILKAASSGSSAPSPVGACAHSGLCCSLPARACRAAHMLRKMMSIIWYIHNWSVPPPTLPAVPLPSTCRQLLPDQAPPRLSAPPCTLL